MIFASLGGERKEICCRRHNLHCGRDTFKFHLRALIQAMSIYTFMQVVHTEITKVVRTEYSAVKSSIKVSPEQATTAVIIALVSEENILMKTKQKRKV